MVGQQIAPSNFISRMTSLELPPIKSSPKKDSPCPTRDRSFLQRNGLNRSLEFSECVCNRHNLTSSSSGCSNPNLASRCQKCSAEKKSPNSESKPRSIPQPKTQRGVMRREMTWHSGGAVNKSLPHSNSTSSVASNTAVAASPRLKPLRSNNTSTKTSTSGEKVTLESGSCRTDANLAHVNSYNSLTNLKERLPGSRTSRLTVPHSPGFGANSGVYRRRSVSQTRPGTSQISGRRLNGTDKNNNSRSVSGKGTISRNQRNELDTTYARDTEQRIINWLIGVEDSEPEEPLAPFFEYVDVPQQTDTAIHIVYKGD